MQWWPKKDDTPLLVILLTKSFYPFWPPLHKGVVDFTNFCKSKKFAISTLCETINSNFLSTNLNIFVVDVVENLQKEDVLIERQEEGKNF